MLALGDGLAFSTWRETAFSARNEGLEGGCGILVDGVHDNR
jgi:hypothetical protein